jgi:hypothetical protein
VQGRLKHAATIRQKGMNGGPIAGQYLQPITDIGARLPAFADRQASPAQFLSEILRAL